MTKHLFHPTVLREYDIRGTYGDTLTTKDAAALGRAFGSVVLRDGKAGKQVCVGYDGRVSSPDLEKALVEGLASTGCDVLRIGLGPTPMLYFSVFHYNSGAGVMVTGSHNPKDQNGFKIMLGKSSFHGADITRLGDIAKAGDFPQGRGTVDSKSPFAAYVDALVGAYPTAPNGKKLVVAWDPGNGAAGDAVRALTARLPGRHILINEKIDGTFPAHHPDPTEEKNLEQLRATVRANHCDLGLAFDGDGDRLGVVDGSGEVVWADQILALVAKEVLENHPGATVVADVKSSQVLYDEIRRLGGKPLMWKTGHALIKSKMREIGAPLAGELSGHLFFADRYYGFDDALYAAVRVLAMVTMEKGSLADLVNRLPKLVNTPEMRFFCAEEHKFEVIDEVKARVVAAGASVIDIDGVRIQTPDGWWLLRASNTQAALVVRAEARDKAALARLRKAVELQLSQSGVKLPDEDAPLSHH